MNEYTDDTILFNISYDSSNTLIFDKSNTLIFDEIDNTTYYYNPMTELIEYSYNYY